MECPDPKLRYLPGGLRAARPVVRRSRRSATTRGGGWSRLALDAVGSVGLHLFALVLALLLPGLLERDVFQDTSGERARVAAFVPTSERLMPLPFDELEETPPRVVPELTPDEAVLVETPVDALPEAREQELSDWPPVEPLAALHAASWKRPLPEPVLADPSEAEVAAVEPPASPPPEAEPSLPAEAEVDEPLAVLSPPPVYPRKARRLGWEGTVELRMRIDAEGAVLGVEVMSSSGHGVLDRAAQEALGRWVFRPRQASDPLVRVFRKRLRFALD